LPNPESEYENLRSTVAKQPQMLRDPTKKAFLGTMGACGNKSLYQSYLLDGELYHCQLDEALVAWAKKQSEPMCTWGFGEMAPPGDSKTNAHDYAWTSE